MVWFGFGGKTEIEPNISFSIFGVKLKLNQISLFQTVGCFALVRFFGVFAHPYILPSKPLKCINKKKKKNNWQNRRYKYNSRGQSGERLLGAEILCSRPHSMYYHLTCKFNC